MATMSCLTIIRSARDKMSANEKKLADFILDNAPLVRDYSSQQIAGSVGISQSSVVKFSQKLGYKGFTDLKLAIHESVVKRGSNVAVLRQESAKGKDISLRERLLRSKCDALSSATDLNDDESILAAVTAIELANRIQLIGIGSTSLIAKDLAFKLMGHGKAVMADGDAQVQLAGMMTFGEGDCLIVVSVSGQEPEVVQIVKEAKNAGVTVISLTDQSANPTSALANIRLYSVSRGGDTDIPNVIAAASQQHVVDLLYCTLAQQGRNDKTAGKGKKAATLRQARPKGRRVR
jgi:DNA-binding MurR/RpiR family transcriptional regulator